VCALYSVHNTAQNRPDNFTSYPPDNHHCSNDVYLNTVLSFYQYFYTNITGPSSSIVYSLVLLLYSIVITLILLTFPFIPTYNPTMLCLIIHKECQNWHHHSARWRNVITSKYSALTFSKLWQNYAVLWEFAQKKYCNWILQQYGHMQYLRTKVLQYLL